MMRLKTFEQFGVTTDATCLPIIGQSVRYKKDGFDQQVPLAKQSHQIGNAQVVAIAGDTIEAENAKGEKVSFRRSQIIP